MLHLTQIATKRNAWRAHFSNVEYRYVRKNGKSNRDLKCNL